jgi:hypothetical protein
MSAPPENGAEAATDARSVMNVEKCQMTTISGNVLSDLSLAPPSAVQTQWSRFDRIRRFSSGLVAGLSGADASGKSMPDASPSKWHLAHTTWFFETFMLRDFVPGYRLFDPAFAFLYNSYHEAEGDRLARPFRGMLTRPSLDEVLAYRRHVDIAMMRVIDDLPASARDLLLLGCNHEEQHQELLLTDPVQHVNYYEADVFARWAAERLPTEAEWESAADGAHATRGVFLDYCAVRPAPARAGDGIRQLFGDLWEWTASPFVAYPDFRPEPGAVGEYNGKFMSGQFVLRGGSCATPRGHVRASYRNFFYPDQRWQFTGLRLAKDV